MKPNFCGTFLLFVLLFCKISFSQQNYIEYARQISMAEAAILHDDYKTAFQVYDHVFSSFEKCFPNDLFIAAQAAALQNEYAKCYHYLKKGFEWGLRTECLNYPAFKDFNQSVYHDSVAGIYEQKQAIYRNRIHPDYRKECVQLYFRDQKANKTHHFLNILIPALGRRAEKKLDDTCAVLLKELSLLIEQHGAFPSVYNTGVRDTSLLSTTVLPDGRDYWIIATIFWHYPFAFQEFESLLYKALTEGNLSAWHYALIRDFAKTHFDNATKRSKNVFKYKDYQYLVYWLNPHETMPNDQLDFFNKNRKAIGLMSLEDEQLKKKCSLSYNSYQQKINLEENEKKFLIYFDYFYL